MTAVTPTRHSLPAAALHTRRGGAFPTVMVIIFAVTIGVLAIIQATAQTAVTNERVSAHEDLVQAGISFANKIRLNMQEGEVVGDLTKYRLDNDGSAYPLYSEFRGERDSTVYGRYRLEDGSNSREKRIIVETYREFGASRRQTAQVSVLVSDRSGLPFSAYWGSGLDVGNGLSTYRSMGIDGDLNGSSLVDGSVWFGDDVFVTGEDKTEVNFGGDSSVFDGARIEVPDVRFDIDRMISDVKANTNVGVEEISKGVINRGSAKGAKIRFDPADPGFYYLSESNANQNAVNNPFGNEVRRPLPAGPEGAMLLMDSYQYVVVEGTYTSAVTIVAQDGANMLTGGNLQSSDPEKVPAIGLIATGDFNVRVARNRNDYGYGSGSTGTLEARIFASGRFGVEGRGGNNSMAKLDIRSSIIVDGATTDDPSDDVSTIAGERNLWGLQNPEINPPGMTPTYIYGVYPFHRVITGTWTFEY